MIVKTSTNEETRGADQIRGARLPGVRLSPVPAGTSRRSQGGARRQTSHGAACRGDGVRTGEPVINHSHRRRRLPASFTRRRSHLPLGLTTKLGATRPQAARRAPLSQPRGQAAADTQLTGQWGPRGGRQVGRLRGQPSLPSVSTDGRRRHPRPMTGRRLTLVTAAVVTAEIPDR